ncbi:receptor protein-tyrosine kinase [Duganella sp. 1224]|uniref:chain length determinant protein tyrosine kinase EpsG n=1 Tax=Duganella sp. 1224 TaxID=2587052 RepID=UPI0015CD10D7|nr:chain length determinant protein tyrosine kinase EpsG [Duganella sp. 1224]NYE62163.1 receptor protein-tyrosine kinase [Duganella sp. 1224]
MNSTPNYVVSEVRDAAAEGPDRSIGAILVKTGRLSQADSERITRFQVERKMRFGDAALELGLLTQADIEFALSRQFDYPYLLAGESQISADVVAAYEPFSSRVEALRGVRNQLMWRWFETGQNRRALAITGAQRGDGRSFLAANLAVVFSQQGQRTLLIDADMRNPSQHQLFSLENRSGLSAILAGRGNQSAIQRVPGLLDLSVLTAGATPPNPLELLGRPTFGQLLEELVPQFDVILIDTPASAENSDAQMVAVRAGAAMIVARQDGTALQELDALVGLLQDARVHVVGTVLNNF